VYDPFMQFVCDAPDGKTWFRMETEAEAARESEEMKHAVEKYFRREREKAAANYRPTSQLYIERDIGLSAHLSREMPLFLTLRDHEGNALATAMLPPQGRNEPGFRIIIVGPANADPYSAHADAIDALGKRYGLTLDRESCFPYARGT
jgi:hypothetical protein